MIHMAAIVSSRPSTLPMRPPTSTITMVIAVPRAITGVVEVAEVRRRARMEAEGALPVLGPSEQGRRRSHPDLAVGGYRRESQRLVVKLPETRAVPLGNHPLLHHLADCARVHNPESDLCTLLDDYYCVFPLRRLLVAPGRDLAPYPYPDHGRGGGYLLMSSVETVVTPTTLHLPDQPVGSAEGHRLAAKQSIYRPKDRAGFELI
ncbi:hypothetical protein EYZ11_004798 [Aspergillus tanneri]|uniref:Uncharacterized protein n=1 Tax=Aspergillus tanneri TaxID=1220188 RepID=A0A4S3JK58_9EURO|nr:hypothetical protein EYZ11_004798 [Aspergillus tanneri]